MILTYKNRQVDLEPDISGAACDAYFVIGNYIDGSMEELGDAELDELTEMYQDKLCELSLEKWGYHRE